MKSTSPKIQTFEEFWPYYLSLHAHPWTKRIHMLGTVLAIGWIVWCVAANRWALLPLALVVGYGPAWISHFFIEKNKPATWEYPWWSFKADFKLLYLSLSGRR